VRLLALAAALVGALLLLALGRGMPLPWEPGCTVADASGQVLAQGPPAEISVLVAAPEGDLARALGAGPVLTCRISGIGATDTPKEAPLGLTPRAQALREEVRDVFGEVPAGGFGPEEVLAGRSPNGEHSRGRAIDFFFRPHEDAGQAEAGWRLANWSVANAERLGIRTVIYRDRIWTARRSAQGWREYRFRGPDPDNPINRHLDHVHVDVA
jgi:hypothetical protein